MALRPDEKAHRQWKPSKGEAVGAGNERSQGGGGACLEGGIKRCVINAWETRGVTLEWLTFVMLVGRSADIMKHFKLASGVAGTYPGPQMAMVGRGGTGGVEYQWEVVKNEREEKKESL